MKRKRFILSFIIIFIVMTSIIYWGKQRNNSNENEIDKWEFKSNNPYGIGLNSQKLKLMVKKPIVIAVIDDGINFNDLNINYSEYINKNEVPNNHIDDDVNGFVDDYSGWDFVNNDNSQYDNISEDNHGTIIAKIIAGKENGILANVSILSLKVFEKNHTDVSNIIKAIKYAENMGAQIVNCSFVIGTYNKDLYNTIKNSNMIFITAAGNSNSNKLLYPGSYDLPNIINVAGINKYGYLSSNSSYGNQVDIAAPGESIRIYENNGTYETFTGTSFATAYVTAAMAFIIGNINKSSYYTYKEVLLNNCKKDDKIIDYVPNGRILNIGEIQEFIISNSK